MDSTPPLRPTYVYALVIAYDGAAFCGWQEQTNLPSVQALVQECFWALCQESVRIFAAGRTDKGVHALGQVAHVVLGKSWDCEVLRRGLNHFLREHAVSIRHVYPMPLWFHARFCATQRQYRYTLWNSPRRHVLRERYAWWVRAPLDISAMMQGANIFTGYHDFSHFRHKECQSTSPMRTITEFTIHQRQDPLEVLEGNHIDVIVKAQSFLHRQVRMMVGALVYVGRHIWSLEDLARVLACEQPYVGPTIAPAHGLYLTHVNYEPTLEAWLSLACGAKDCDLKL